MYRDEYLMQETIAVDVNLNLNETLILLNLILSLSKLCIHHLPLRHLSVNMKTFLVRQQIELSDDNHNCKQSEQREVSDYVNKSPMYIQLIDEPF